jgi:prenyltransferase beta subunit
LPPLFFYANISDANYLLNKNKDEKGIRSVKPHMKRLNRYVMIFILTLFGLMSMGAAKGKKDAVRFDFKGMRSYFHALLDTRHHFPDSIVLMNDYVYSLTALGEPLDPQRKERMIAFAKELQQPDGGFSIDTETKASSSLYTDYALETLAYMNSIGSIDVGKAKSYFSSLKQPDGGFSFNTQKKESAFITTYQAVHSLFLLNGLNLVDKAKTAEYIKSFEKKDTGGFSYVKGTGIPNAKNTYMGVSVLKTLGMLDDDTKKRAIKFLASTPYIGKFKKSAATLTLEEQVYTLSALRILDSAQILNKEKVELFIKTFYLPDEGGFTAIQGFKAAPDPTCLGIRGLAELGLLKRPIESPLK